MNDRKDNGFDWSWTFYKSSRKELNNFIPIKKHRDTLKIECAMTFVVNNSEIWLWIRGKMIYTINI